MIVIFSAVVPEEFKLYDGMFVWRTILLVSTYHCHQAIQCIFYHEMYLFSTKYFIWFIVKGDIIVSLSTKDNLIPYIFDTEVI